MSASRMKLLETKRKLKYFERSYSLVKRVRDALLGEIMLSIR